MWLLQESKFSKSKDIADLCRVNFEINKLFIQYNRRGCCKHIAGGVNTYLYGCVSLLNNLYAVHLCVISNGRLVKNHIICQTSLNLIPCYIKTQQEHCGWKKFEKQGGLE